VHAFTIEENHRQLTVTATSRVQVEAPEIPDPKSTPAWETIPEGVIKQTDPHWFGACPFQFDSTRVVRSEQFAHYARESFQPKRPVLDAAIDLTQRIHRDFKYDTKSTDVTTSTEEAFAIRKGVCQDFAHIQVACLRSIGLPARYVSGYLRTVPPPGKARIPGADQSHAWVSVYCGSAGWVDLDPTRGGGTSTTSCRSEASSWVAARIG
jgi:transglutaminase-like putative cysteine protease